MAADALAQASVARSSAAMLLTIYDKHIQIFHVEGVKMQMYIFYISQNESACKGLTNFQALHQYVNKLQILSNKSSPVTCMLEHD